MRIAYFAQTKIHPEDGVFKKIRSQTKHWIAAGSEVRWFFLVEDPIQFGNDFEVNAVLEQKGGLRQRVSATRRLFQALADWKPDVIYARFGFFSPAQWNAMRGVPTIIEANTNDLAEFKNTLNPFLWSIHRFTRRLILSSAKGIVSVTHEVSELFEDFKAERLVIGNGIDLEAIPPLEPTQSTQPRLVFMGSAGLPWHGLDKVYSLAERFKDWQFELIGDHPANIRLPNVTMHGRLAPGQYKGILAESDIAISSLSLYLNGMDEACPLKSREYLAYGLPMIAGYADPDFPEEVPFILTLPNTSDGLEQSFAQIEQFVSEWQGKRVDRTLVNHLSSVEKESQRLAFIQKIVERG